MALCFGVHNRVNTIETSPPTAEDDTTAACDLPPSSFLPTMHDHLRRRDRAAVIVERILANYIPVREEHLAKLVCKHIPHAHSREMEEKSEIVSI